MLKGNMIGLVGFAGAGKDTVAEHIVAKYGFFQMSFAKKLKEIVSTAFDVPLHFFEDRELKNAIHPSLHYSTLDRKFQSGCSFVEYLVPMLMELYDKDEAEIRDLRWAEIAAAGFYQLLPDDGCSPRRAAQLVGTKLFREQICQTTWLDYLERHARLILLSGGNVVVSDLRFPDEVQVIHRLSGTNWYVNRAVVENHDHVSEKHILALRSECDFELLNVGTIDTLKFNVDSVYEGRFKQSLAA